MFLRLNAVVMVENVKGFGINDLILESLYRTARDMLRSREERRKVKNDDVEGVITTGFSAAGIGTFFGIQFQAEIETGRGRSDVRYIVRATGLDEPDGENFWMMLPVAAGSEHPAAKAHLN